MGENLIKSLGSVPSEKWCDVSASTADGGGGIKGNGWLIDSNKFEEEEEGEVFLLLLLLFLLLLSLRKMDLRVIFDVF